MRAASPTLALALLVSGWSIAAAQGTKADYERADGLAGRFRGIAVGGRVAADWRDDGRSFWYRRAGPGGKDARFVHVDVETRRREERASRPGPLMLLKPRPRVRRSRDGGGETAVVFENHTKGTITVIWLTRAGAERSYGTLAAGKTRRQHTFAGHAWLVRDAGGKSLGRYVAAPVPRAVRIDGTAAESDVTLVRRPTPRGRSPDGRWIARIESHDVTLRRWSKKTVRRLTRSGDPESGFHGRVHWSPTSTHFVVFQRTLGGERRIHFVESAPKDRVQPKLHAHPYAKPGDKLTVRRPWLFDVKTGKGEPIDDALFPNPWGISRFAWHPDGRRFSFLYNERGHQRLRVIDVAVPSGEVRVVVEEQSRTFIDYAGKLYLRRMPESGELLWMSERDGWNHLYLFGEREGRVKAQVTKGRWVVRGVDRVDEKARRIWFWAGGIMKGEDPYHRHYCRVDFDGSNLVVLTKGDGTHEVAFSPDRRYFIDTWSRVDLAPVSVLRRSDDGAEIVALERGDLSELEKAGWHAPIRFVAMGRDGKTDIYGVIYRPTTFDEKREYPVVEAIYAGPHSAHVPKSFRETRGPQAVAELGFAVVQIDGMGTSLRSKAFHDVCWRNLGDAGFPDRIRFIKAAAKRYPWMDTTRVGIYGGSAGGQNAMRALIAHHDFYHVAVADCGCHDNRMDKMWWNELWMGWPVGRHYEESSNVVYAHRMKGKLLLIVGETDRNVDPASTMQVVDALVRADKDFDFVVLPGVGHGAAGTPYGRRRLRDHLVRHLLGVEPRWQPQAGK